MSARVLVFNPLARIMYLHNKLIPEGLTTVVWILMKFLPFAATYGIVL